MLAWRPAWKTCTLNPSLPLGRYSGIDLLLKLLSDALDQAEAASTALQSNPLVHLLVQALEALLKSRECTVGGEQRLVWRWSVVCVGGGGGVGGLRRRWLRGREHATIWTWVPSRA